MDLHKRLTELRTAKGYSVAKLSKSSGVAASFIQRIESGEQNPTVDRMEKICRGLGITMADFFNEGNTELTPDMMEFVNKVRNLTQEQIQAFNTILAVLDK